MEFKFDFVGMNRIAILIVATGLSAFFYGVGTYQFITKGGLEYAIHGLGLLSANTLLGYLIAEILSWRHKHG